MFEATVGEYEDRVVIGTYETSAQAFGALGVWLVANPLASSPYAKVTEVEHPIEHATRAIKAELERRPDAQVLIEWIEQNLWTTGSSDPVLGAIATAINTYYVALDEDATQARREND